jgi:Rrf2 family iron-sulfur cluster assembly transcriptional regulator
MRVTTKGRYALRAITKLAMETNGKPVPIKRIASEEEISAEFLEQIFFRLKKAGIIASMRGPGGGFVMNQEPEEITVKAIFDAVGEGIELTPCTSYLDDGNGDCTRKEDCVVHDLWQEVAEHIVQYFDNITLRHVMDKNTDHQYSDLIKDEQPV